MSRRSTVETAYETTLNGSITAGATVIPVASTAGLVVPIYLAIEPDSATLREIIKVETLNGNNLETVTRGLAGSAAGAQGHADAVPVRSVVTEPLVDDVFQDIEDIEDLPIRYHEQADIAQSLPASPAWTKFTNFGNGGGSGDITRITFASNEYTVLDAGTYLIVFNARFASLNAATTLRGVRIVKNGSVIIGQTYGPGGTTPTDMFFLSCSAVDDLAINDVISFEVYENGGNEDLNGGGQEASQAIVRLK